MVFGDMLMLSQRGEKLAIIRADKETSLSKRSELVSKCRHENRYYCKSRIFRMHFIFVYFVHGGFRTKIKCTLKIQSKS